MDKLQIEYLPLSELKPYENNPRINEQAVDPVAESIKQFGFKIPIIIDSNGVIVCGHTRLLAAQKLGLEQVPVIRADDLTDEQIKAFRLVDNKVSEFASWDFDLLSTELDGILHIDMGDFGFDLSSDLDEPTEVIEDEAPEIDETKEPICKLGDIWQLGRHRLMCGDSTSIENVNNLTGGATVDLYLTDPPYNVAYEGKTKDKLTIKNDKMQNDNFRQFLVDAFACADSVMKPGAAFYIWHADSEGYNFRGACSDVGWKIRQCLIWNKNSMVMGRQDYQWKHEPCLYGWKGGAPHLWTSDRKQTTVINFNKPLRNGEHPTMKPVGLFDYLIKNNTKGGDIVLDTFGGSGTSIIACEQNGRTCFTMELDPHYCDVIIQRWENLTGQKAVKLT